jgi:hypothetical protein
MADAPRSVNVLPVTKGNLQASIVADLARTGHIPSNAFDCVILAQTLQLVYDVRSSTCTLHSIPKSSRVLLTTYLGISLVGRVQEALPDVGRSPTSRRGSCSRRFFGG